MKPNPKLYRELNVPTTRADLQVRADAFFKELEELRKKYRIPDVLFVMQAPFISDDGVEGAGTTHGAFGDPLRTALLAAFIYGVYQDDGKKRMEGLAKGGQAELFP